MAEPIPVDVVVLPPVVELPLVLVDSAPLIDELLWALILGASSVSVTNVIINSEKIPAQTNLFFITILRKEYYI